MKKVFIFLALMLTFSASWVKAQTYTYDIQAPLILSVDQMTTNNVSLSDSQGNSVAEALGALIDGDWATMFHSTWHEAMAGAAITEASWTNQMQSLKDAGTHDFTGIGYHNLQVALDFPVEKFIIAYIGRNSATWSDNPDVIQIFATNDANLAASTDNADNESWDEIGTFNLEVENQVSNVSVQSPVIVMEKAYSYIRILMKHTTNVNEPGLNRAHTNTDITGIVWNMAEFQMYEAEEVVDPQGMLQALVDSISTVNPQFVLGTNPGFHSEALYNEFLQARDNAESALTKSLSDDEYKALENKLRTSLHAAEQVILPEDGHYYSFFNAMSGFAELQPDKRIAMTIDPTANQGAWSVYEEKNSLYIFKATKNEDGTYYWQNMANNLYIGSAPKTANGQIVRTTAAPEVKQVLRLIPSTQQFSLRNVENDKWGYDPLGHASGAGTYGYLQLYETSSANNGTAWYIEQIPDDVAEAAIGNADAEINAQLLRLQVEQATAARKKANDYVEVFTKADQVSSNAQSTGDASAYANLIDNNTETIFHSVWNDAMAVVQSEDSEIAYGYHNLQFNFSENPLKAMYFNYIGRVSDTWHDNPNNIGVYVTNNDELGASTAAADSTEWVHITDLVDGFPGNETTANYQSPIIDFGGEAYKYIRLVVRNTTNNGAQSARQFPSAYITGVTFNLSELHVFDGMPYKSSEYYTVPGMKEACDALDALVAAAADKIANKTATAEDVAALEAATKAVNDLYVDRTELQNQMAELLDEGNNLYNEATGKNAIPLVTDVSQLSSNSNSSNDSSSLANLIDGGHGNVFHSVWDEAMRDNTDITPEEWLAVLESDHAGQYTGAGYHNLQVKFNVPVENFFIDYYGRTGSDWHDNPNDIEIYVTNSDELGAKVDQSDIDLWTKVTEIADETIPDVAEYHYRSPLIDLGGSYKYARLVIKNTTHRDKVDSRIFNTPDVTGVTWNVSELNLMQGLDPARNQYNYNEDVKTAADALGVLLDELNALEAYQYTTEHAANLRAAIDAVRASYADTTELVAKYKVLKAIAEHATPGEGIGYVDEQASVDAYLTSLASAKASVDPIQPTKEAVDAAMDAMDAAYATFMTHVTMPQPNKWYCIRAGSIRAGATDQPIFLWSISTGDQLHTGGYNLETENPAVDPYAIWRLVPIEGTTDQYAIQNMGSAHFFGEYRGDGAGSSPLTVNHPVPYYVQLFGDGFFKFIQVSRYAADPMDALKYDQTNSVVLNYPLNNDQQQQWRFEEVDEGETFSIRYLSSGLQIMTLPFAIEGDTELAAFNDGVKTYALKNITPVDGEGIATVELTLQNEFAAGEPFIIDIPEGTSQIDFGMPGDVTTQVQPANGIIGTLDGISVGKKGLGFFNSGKLYATTSNGSVTYDGRSGYLDPNQVTDKTDATVDLTLTCKGLDGIKGLKQIATMDGNANIYTIDGKLVKKNANSVKGLNKGIYIIGKKKVAIK